MAKIAEIPDNITIAKEDDASNYAKITNFLYAGTAEFVSGMQPVPGELYVNTTLDNAPIYEYIGSADTTVEQMPEEGVSNASWLEVSIARSYGKFDTAQANHDALLIAEGGLEQAQISANAAAVAAKAAADAAEVAETDAQAALTAVLAIQTQTQGSETAASNAATEAQNKFNTLQTAVTAANSDTLQALADTASITTSKSLTDTARISAQAAATDALAAVALLDTLYSESGAATTSGNQHKTFKVATATASIHAPRLEQVLLSANLSNSITETDTSKIAGAPLAVAVLAKIKELHDAHQLASSSRTWVQFTPVNAATYTNTTGAEMMISIYSPQRTVSITIAGLDFLPGGANPGTSIGLMYGGLFLVPIGATYVIQNFGTAGTYKIFRFS